jgi:cell division protease FtsH
MIDINYETAQRILSHNQDKLHLMADALLKYETIDLDQIQEIMQGKVPKPPRDWGDDKPASAAPTKGTTAGTTKGSASGDTAGDSAFADTANEH